jgi:hypothetical protein
LPADEGEDDENEFVRQDCDNDCHRTCRGPCHLTSRLQAQRPPAPAAVQIGGTDLGGVVTSANGPEAGVCGSLRRQPASTRYEAAADYRRGMRLIRMPQHHPSLWNASIRVLCTVVPSCGDRCVPVPIGPYLQDCGEGHNIIYVDAELSSEAGRDSTSVSACQTPHGPGRYRGYSPSDLAAFYREP